jgi:hypothetical protein
MKNAKLKMQKEGREPHFNLRAASASLLHFTFLILH